MDIKRLFPNASASAIAANTGLQGSQSKYHEATALGGAVQGEAEGVHRVRVCFTGYRVRCLDPDNFAGGCKDLLDGLRHSALLSGDEPWEIDFQTRQEKVAHRSEEKTVIEIDY